MPEGFISHTCDQTIFKTSWFVIVLVLHFLPDSVIFFSADMYVGNFVTIRFEYTNFAYGIYSNVYASKSNLLSLYHCMCDL